jgi:hypothetical protein
MWLGAALCGGCASNIDLPAKATDEWRAMPLPGKRETVYSRCEYEGRPAWHASSRAAASVWHKRVNNTVVTPATHVEFAWWVANTIRGADLRRAEVADSPVRLGFAFDGDLSRLSLRNRMQFQFVEAMTGEAPPFAMLMYVWDNHADVETVMPSTAQRPSAEDRAGEGRCQPAPVAQLSSQSVHRLSTRLRRGAWPVDRHRADDRH